MTPFKKLKVSVLFLSLSATIPWAEAHKPGEPHCGNINCVTMSDENPPVSIIPSQALVTEGKHPLESSDASNEGQPVSKKAKVSSQSESNQHSNQLPPLLPDLKVDLSEAETRISVYLAHLQEWVENPRELRKKPVTELGRLLTPLSKLIKGGMIQLKHSDQAGREKLITQSLLFLSVTHAYFSDHINFTFSIPTNKTVLPFFEDLYLASSHLSFQQQLGNWKPLETEAMIDFYSFFSIVYKFESSRFNATLSSEDVETVQNLLIKQGEALLNELERNLNERLPHRLFTTYALYLIYTARQTSSDQSIAQTASLKRIEYYQKYFRILPSLYVSKWPRIGNEMLRSLTTLIKRIAKRGIEPIKHLEMAIHLIETEMTNEIKDDWTVKETQEFIQIKESLEIQLEELRKALELAKNPPLSSSTPAALQKLQTRCNQLQNQNIQLQAQYNQLLTQDHALVMACSMVQNGMNTFVGSANQVLTPLLTHIQTVPVLLQVQPLRTQPSQQTVSASPSLLPSQLAASSQPAARP